MSSSSSPSSSPSSSSSSSSRRSWDDSFALLLSFKEQHGHLNVPYDYEKDKLGYWFKNQRYAFKRKQEGKEHTCSYRISDEHIRRLDKIGFPWLAATTTTTTTTTDTTPASPKKLSRPPHGRKKIAHKSIRCNMASSSQQKNKNGLVDDYDDDDDAPTRKKRHYADITVATTDVQQGQQQPTPSLAKMIKTCSSEENSTTRFQDVVGHDTAKAQSAAILWPLLGPSWTPTSDSSIMTENDKDVCAATAAVTAGAAGAAAPPTTSMLLSGPKGCGKTLLARAIAGEALAPFLSIALGQLKGLAGDDLTAVARSFIRRAQKCAVESKSKCAVVFLKSIHDYDDDDDDGASSEGEYASRFAFIEKILNQADAIARRQKQQTTTTTTRATDVHVLVVATTSTSKRLEDCSPTTTALLRHFGAHLTVGLPQDDDRKELLTRYLAGEDSCHHSITPSQMFDLSAQLEGWSGSEIKKLTQEAVMAPFKEYVEEAQQRRWQLKETGGMLPILQEQQGSDGKDHLRPVNMDDFANTFTV